MRNSIKVLMACLGIAVLILDSRTALMGAAEGIELCLRAVIPSLFPFFVLTVFLTSCLSGAKITLLGPLGKLFRIPRGAEPLLLTGLLGGYPAGAQAVSQAYEAGQLSKLDAQRMLVLCNNCGPAFLFGMASAAFGSIWTSWLIWSIVIVSAWITSLLLPRDRRTCPQTRSATPLTLLQAMERSVQIMARVCGWIVLFRVLLCFLERWTLWYFPGEISCVVNGTLELANGCLLLKDVTNEGLRFMICAGLLSFGGLCVTMQTFSVISSDLDKGYYFPGKVLQGCISMMIAYLLQLTFSVHIAPFPWAIAGIGLIIGAYLLKIRKKCSILAPVGV